jgi:hypothetical protein
MLMLRALSDHRFLRLIASSLLLTSRAFAETSLEIETPMSPPAWALLERALLEANSRAVEAFANKYMDSRGYLLHTPRWGTLDGPDDAIETYYNWTLLHALGGSDSVLQLYKKGLDGHSFSGDFPNPLILAWCSE